MNTLQLTKEIAQELKVACSRLSGPSNFALLPVDWSASPTLYSTFAAMGADSELLAIVGSYGIDLPDEHVLVALRKWNAGKPAAYPR